MTINIPDASGPGIKPEVIKWVRNVSQFDSEILQVLNEQKKSMRKIIIILLLGFLQLILGIYSVVIHLKQFINRPVLTLGSVHI